MLFRGRPVWAYTGRSWLPAFSSSSVTTPTSRQNTPLYPDDSYVGWELHARAAIRKGKWKIVHIPKAWGGKGVGDHGNLDGWELYDLLADPGETTDLRDEYPEVYKDLLKCWDEYVVDCQIVWGVDAMGPGLSKEEAPELHEDDLALQKAWMSARAGEVPVM